MTTSGKIKGLCDGCESLSELKTDEYGLWLCNECAKPYAPELVTRNNKTVMINLGL